LLLASIAAGIQGETLHRLAGTRLDERASDREVQSHQRPGR
jgi:hypothetical protein